MQVFIHWPEVPTEPGSFASSLPVGWCESSIRKAACPRRPRRLLVREHGQEAAPRTPHHRTKPYKFPTSIQSLRNRSVALLSFTAGD